MSAKMNKKNRWLALGLAACIGIGTALTACRVLADPLNDGKSNVDTINFYYGLKSYDAFKQLLEPKVDGKGKSYTPISKVGSVAFQWAEVNINSKDNALRLQSKMPTGFEEPVTLASEKGAKTYLSVFMNTGYDRLFGLQALTNTDEKPVPQSAAADWFLAQLDEQIFSKQGFDGVVVDFEALPKVNQTAYLDFISALDQRLKARGVELWVAVAPGTVADYNLLLSHVDRVILMLHDYEAKKLGVSRVSNQVVTPLVPVSKLERDLNAVTNAIKDKKQLDKLSLQFNMATAQWKVQNGKLLNTDTSGTNAYPYRPEYSSFIDKWQALLAAKVKVQAGYNPIDQSPYLYYLDPADQVYNTITYENKESIQAKVALAQKYGIKHFSVWRLGNIPDNTPLHLDVMSYLLSLVGPQSK